MYHLAGKNIKKFVEEAIGTELSELGMRYNKKHKYWYRMTEGKVMQYLGMEMSSGGMYDLNFGFQMIYVPISHTWYEDTRGIVPVEYPADGAQMVLDYINSGLISDNDKYYHHYSKYSVPEEEIPRHMQHVFRDIILPIFEAVTDEEMAWQWAYRHKELRLVTIGMHAKQEYVDHLKKLSDRNELLMLIRRGENELAKKRYEEDLSNRSGKLSPYGHRSPVEWIGPYLDAANKEAFEQKLCETEAENRKRLTEDGFILDY